MDTLSEKSEQIDIIAGAIYLEDGNYYNATYHFKKGNLNIAKKVVLVPLEKRFPFKGF